MILGRDLERLNDTDIYIYIYTHTYIHTSDDTSI